MSFSQSFSYDVYGNLNCAPSGPGCVGFTYSAANNRIATSGYSYDASGNVTGDGTNTCQWDAESRLMAVINSSGVALSLNTYNALGQRVEDITQSGTTEEAYGADGSLLLRYTGDSNSRSFVPFGGRILAEYYCGGMIFDHPDEIGSATTATDCTGNTVNEKLYYPFGGFWTGVALPNLGMRQQFAQLPDFDTETNQYNTLYRHYVPTIGRWLSPDPAGLAAVNPANPQSWNRYAYVLNNPLATVDPLGLSCYRDEDGLYMDDGDGAGCPDAGIDSVPEDQRPIFKMSVEVNGDAPEAAPVVVSDVDSQVKAFLCSFIPEGRTTGISGGTGGTGGVVYSYETVVNYNTGETSGFFSGGFNFGWNGGAQASANNGFIFNLGDSNANYSGPFTNISGSYGQPIGFGVYTGISSGGMDHPATINYGQPNVVGVSAGVSVVGSISGGAGVTYYTKPTPLGNMFSFSHSATTTPLDYFMYAARQVCR